LPCGIDRQAGIVTQRPRIRRVAGSRRVPKAARDGSDGGLAIRLSPRTRSGPWWSDLWV